MLYSICFNKNQLEKVFKDKLLSQIDSNAMCCTSCQRNENIHIFTYRILPKIIWMGGQPGGSGELSGGMSRHGNEVRGVWMALKPYLFLFTQVRSVGVV